MSQNRLRFPSKSLRFQLQHLIRSSHNSPQASDSIQKYVFGKRVNRNKKRKDANMWQQNSDDVGCLVFNDYSMKQKTITQKHEEIAEISKNESLKQQRSSSRVNIDLPDMGLIYTKLKHPSKKNRTEPSELLKTSAIQSNKLTLNDRKSHKQIERVNTFLFSSPTKHTIRPPLPKLVESPKDDHAMLAVLNRIQGTKISRPSNFRMDKDKLSNALIERFGFQHFTEYYNLQASQPFPSISSIVESFLNGSYRNQLQFIFATYDFNKDGNICEQDIWNLIKVADDVVLTDISTMGDFISKNRIGSKQKLQKQQSSIEKISMRTSKNKSLLSKKNRVKQFFSTQVLKQDTQRTDKNSPQPIMKRFRISFQIFRLIFNDHPPALLSAYIQFFTKQTLPADTIPQCKTISLKQTPIESTRGVQVRQTIVYLSEARHQRKYLKECNVKY